LRDWVKTAYHAKKLAETKDFYEMKALMEKIGTNHRLWKKKIDIMELLHC